MGPPEIDFEAQYNNRARVADHAAHMAGWQKDAAAYRASARCDIDIAYGPGERHRFDLFHPEGESEGPVVLFIHGGYWQALDKTSASHLARGANLRGLTVAVPSYGLAPAVPLAAIIEDLSRAADRVEDRMGRPLIAVGHSAGGHLAACLMARRSPGRRPVRAAMPISGLFDLGPLVSTSLNRALGLTPMEAQRLSPLDWPAPGAGHLVAVVGGAESAEYHRQSQQLVDRWGAAGVATHLRVLPEAHHFNVLAGLADPSDPLVDDIVALAAAT